MSRVAVLDIGKTNVKFAVIDPARGAELEVRRMPNPVLAGPPYPHHDTGAIWDFLCAGLRELAAAHEISALSVTTHGATGALTDGEGRLAMPVLDYEHRAVAETAAGYDALRPPFSETGSPRLAAGLNLGAQLHWQRATFAEAREAALFLPYPQYWTCRLTGVPAAEATSLGAHTDLWNPWAGTFSSLVERAGWRGLMAPLRRAGDVLGPVRPELAGALGLPEGLPVLCGIHDSNASLYPHVLGRAPPFSVVSTGTWVIAMALGGAGTALDPARDTLVNVDALGDPVPSARFMGGREYEMLRAGRGAAPTPGEIAAVLERRVMLLPAVEPGSGPFRGREARWTAAPATDGEHAAAVAFYLALMSATCLDLIGAAGETVVEGPFAGNAALLDMLRAATGRPVIAAEAATGTALGAALLAGGAAPPPCGTAGLAEPAPAFAAYAAEWRAAAG